MKAKSVRWLGVLAVAAVLLLPAAVLRAAEEGPDLTEALKKAGWKAEARKVKVGTPKGDKDKEIVYYTNSLGMKFVLIPAGEFQMGSPADEAGREDNEGPQHKVRLTRTFYLGACEVTNGQYRKFRKAHDSDSGKRAELVKRGDLSLNHDDQPVLAVSWDDAKAFCDWLSKKEGAEYRLPTEAEWEYACRAGSTERYWWGESEKDAGKYGNVYDKTGNAEFKFGWTAFETDDGYAVTAPVGKYLPNAFGLHDMIGNAWEWCGDWFDEKYYARSPKDDPAGPAGGAQRVLCGGSWHGGPWCVRCAHRGRGVPTARVDFIGFRVAVSAPK